MTMNKIAAVLILPALLLGACKKKPAEEAAPPAAAATTAPAPAPAAPAQLSEADEEMAKKKALLDYGMMEDKYLNDAKGQWATAAKASSTFSNVDIKQVLGKPDGNNWSNDNQEQGLDKPVSATEVRLVIDEGHGVEAITKMELQGTDGKWNTVWEGINDVKKDARGRRTWFVKTFPATSYKVKAVKYTIANNLYHGYKDIDAAQLIGE
jgi:hypothetical protein